MNFDKEGDKADIAQFNNENRVRIRQAAWWNRLAYIQRKLPKSLKDSIDALQLQPDAHVLDFGCADRPYRVCLPASCRYVGADLPGNADADAQILPDGRLSSADAEFDAVLSTQVLEHVADPEVYLAESFRLLKPGGQLLLSTHGLMFYHPDPVDYWRWTREGLDRILSKAGFEVVEIEGVMGLAATGLQFLQDGLLGSIPRFLRPPIVLMFQGLIALMDKLTSSESRRFNSLVYIAHARKPPTGSAQS